MLLPGWHCLHTPHIPWVEQKLGEAHRIFFRVLYIESGRTHALAAILVLLRKGHFPLLLKKKSKWREEERLGNVYYHNTKNYSEQK